jgi:hypothetical protein
VFGRDEADNGFVFTQQQVDQMLVRWHHIVSKTEGTSGFLTKCSPDAIQTLELVIADANKPLLLANEDFLPFLLECLMLDPQHPRLASDAPASMDWLQQMASECFAQLSMFPPGAAALRAAAERVRHPLEAVASPQHGGRTEQARKFARASLAALFPNEHQRPQPPGRGAAATRGEDDGLAQLQPSLQHIMVSYNWGQQVVIKRIARALKARKYRVWIDIEKMQGSTIEAMAAAVEDAAVVCYGISQAYKESVNCRMEAQYAHQREKDTDMLPLMLEEGYRPNGWLGMLACVSGTSSMARSWPRMKHSMPR